MLNNQTIATILAAIEADGQASVTAQIQAAFVAQKVTSTTAALAPAISFTVSDWDAVEAFVAAGMPSQAVYPLRDAVRAKLEARDASGLGVLLLMLHAATKSHFGA